jgi:cysteine desulfurase
VYLDSNATTRPAPEVVAAMREALEVCWHNPSSIHRPGQAARQKVELARKEVAALIGARARSIVFTGSGTEALDLAVRGVLAATGKRVLVTTAIEHGALRGLARSLAERGEVEVRLVPCAAGGVIEPAAVEAALDDRVGLVSVQWANNETGVVHPVDAIGEVCRRRGVVFHCDGTQWVGKMPVDVGDAPGSAKGAPPTLPLPPSPNGEARRAAEVDGRCEAWGGRGANVDILTFSPHKFHGPKGVGVLYCRAGVPLSPVIHGEQELGRRGGTENVPGIVGAGVAARLAREWLADPPRRERAAGLRHHLEAGVQAACEAWGGAVVNGPVEEWKRLWNTASIAFPRLEADALLLLLSERGVCASAGSACSSGSLEPSPVIRAMGVPEDLAHGTVRFSLSRETTEGEIDRAVAIIAECVSRLRQSTVSAG